MPVPDLGPAVPQRGTALSRRLGRAVLRATGWDFEGVIPNRSHFVIIGAPHTSNWDFLYAMATMLALGIDVRWLGKHTLFRGPLGPVMRWLGGVPVDRRRPGGLVERAVAHLQERERFVLGIAPEGTRRFTPRWKTGFYRIACRAGVPILPVYFDYARKVVGAAPLFTPTGDMEADIAALRAFYRTVTPRRPAWAG